MKNLFFLFLLLFFFDTKGQNIVLLERKDTTITGVGYKFYYKIVLSDNSEWLIHSDLPLKIGLPAKPKTYPWRELIINGITYDDYSKIHSK